MPELATAPHAVLQDRDPGALSPVGKLSGLVGGGREEVALHRLLSGASGRSGVVLRNDEYAILKAFAEFISRRFWRSQSHLGCPGCSDCPVIALGPGRRY